MKKNISPFPGIYIHIPYCDTKCGYCDFYSVTNHSGRKLFIPSLIKEIESKAGEIPEDTVFDTLYLGGGTPSLLRQDELEPLFESLHKNLHFAENTEITIEANPGTISKESFRLYGALGINRLSIGIQSFSDAELKFLGRIHTAGQAINTVNLAREEDIRNISIDLIFALPGQTLKQWRQNLKTAMSLNPEHISAYNLIFEEGTPFYTSMLNGNIVPKQDGEESRFFSETIQFLAEKKYVHYEISNFARDESLFSRHNYKYWNHTNYLGFGPSAHSFWGQKRWSNIRSVAQYVDGIQKGESPEVFSETLNTETRIFESIFLGLRTLSGVDLNRFESLYKTSFLDLYNKIVQDLIADGFAEISGSHFRLTRKGLFICDEILPAFAPN
ncbi:MAG: radical SAM family heme chaperone HemW [Calditrichaceae bacterium]